MTGRSYPAPRTVPCRPCEWPQRRREFPSPRCAQGLLPHPSSALPRKDVKLVTAGERGMDLILDRLRLLEQFDELLDTRVILVVAARHKGNRELFVLDARIDQPRSRVKRARGDDEMRIALRQIDIAGDTDQLRPLDLGEFQIARVLDNIVKRAKET